jgi:hypothetical protein
VLFSGSNQVIYMVIRQWLIVPAGTARRRFADPSTERVEFPTSPKEEGESDKVTPVCPKCLFRVSSIRTEYTCGVLKKPLLCTKCMLLLCPLQHPKRALRAN